MFFVVNIVSIPYSIVQFHLLANELCRLFLGIVMEKDITNTFALVTHHHSFQLVPSDNSTLRCNTINVETIKFLNTYLQGDLLQLPVYLQSSSHRYSMLALYGHFYYCLVFQAVTLTGSSKDNIIMSKIQQRYSNEPYLSGV